MSSRVPIFRTAPTGAALLLVLAGDLAAADDVLRCGGSLVRVGMVSAEVVAKCGEPKTREVEEVPVRVRTRSGGTNTVGVTTTERWIYDRGPGMFPALLTFEEGKLKSLEFLTDR